MCSVQNTHTFGRPRLTRPLGSLVLVRPRSLRDDGGTSRSSSAPRVSYIKRLHRRQVRQGPRGNDPLLSDSVPCPEEGSAIGGGFPPAHRGRRPKRPRDLGFYPRDGPAVPGPAPAVAGGGEGR